MANNVDAINYVISLEAEQAVQQLEALNAQTTSWDAKITAVTAKVQQLSAQWGTSFQATTGILKNADAEMQQATQSAGVFGQQVTNSATGATKSLSNIGFRQVAQEAEDAAPRAVRSIDAIRIALGALTAMIVFNVVQAFQQFFTGAIKDAYDLEGALYNLANAERIMSQQGIQIAPKDLQDQINNLQRLVPIISQIDATKAVSSIALFTKDLGYTKDQIGALSEAVGVLYVRNKAMGLSFEQVLSQVQTGLLTGRAQGIRDLGVSISEAAIEQEALRMGLVKTDKEFKNLTGDIQTQIKAQAMLSIIVKNTAQEQGSLGQYMQTNAGRMDLFTSTLTNFRTAAGQAFIPFLAALAEVGTAIIGIYKIYQQVAEFFMSRLVTAFVTPFIVLSEAVQGHIKSVEDFQGIYSRVFTAVDAFIKQHIGLTLEQANAMDTATGSAQQLGSALADMSKVDLSSLNNALISLQDQLAKLNREYAQNQEKYAQEYNLKIQRMQQDYQISVQQTIQEFNNRRADLEAQYRNQQMDAEAKYQEQMRELRSKYLYDLEDALRNRDARQVLRLQAQYKMDKDNLTRNFQIENEARARQYATELAQLKRNEEQKLAEMAAAEKLKEQRAAEDYAIEQAQRKQAYDDALADLKKSWQERLDEEAQKIADNLGITGKGVDEIRKVLEKYYGANGVFDGLYQYSLDSLTEKGSTMLAEMAAIVSQYMAMANSIGGMWGSGYKPQTPTEPTKKGGQGKSQGRASGGIDLVTSPTNFTAGEGGTPELAMFLPLNKPLSQIPNNLPSGGSRDVSGNITIDVIASPDLEARITNNTLRQVADTTLHVYRRRR